MLDIVAKKFSFILCLITCVEIFLIPCLIITFSQIDCGGTAYFSLFVTESEEIQWRQKKDTKLSPLALNLLCMPSARTSMMPWVGSVRLTLFTGMLLSVLLLGCCSCWCLFLMNDVNSHRVILLFPSTNNLVSCQIYLVCSSSYYALWEFTKELMFKLWFT